MRKGIVAAPQFIKQNSVAHFETFIFRLKWHLSLNNETWSCEQSFLDVASLALCVPGDGRKQSLGAARIHNWESEALCHLLYNLCDKDRLPTRGPDVGSCWIIRASLGSLISQACVVCACVRACVCSLSLFLFILHSGGSNVCYFFNTWPCLFGRTYQRRLVGTSLPLPAYLPTVPVWSVLVWSNACRQPCAFFYFPLFLSTFLMTGMNGLSLSWPCHQFFPPDFLSLCALLAPPPPRLVLTIWHFGELPAILLGSLRLLHVCVPVSVSEAQTDELGKWNEARCSRHLIGRGEQTRRIERGKTWLNKGQREGWSKRS